MKALKKELQKFEGALEAVELTPEQLTAVRQAYYNGASVALKTVLDASEKSEAATEAAIGGLLFEIEDFTLGRQGT